jgi:hypothetical protein
MTGTEIHACGGRWRWAGAKSGFLAMSQSLRPMARPRTLARNDGAGGPANCMGAGTYRRLKAGPYGMTSSAGWLVERGNLQDDVKCGQVG